jgi:hypothetical protein
MSILSVPFLNFFMKREEFREEGKRGWFFLFFFVLEVKNSPLYTRKYTLMLRYLAKRTLQSRGALASFSHRGAASSSGRGGGNARVALSVRDAFFVSHFF